jgi:four helix bundle protein
MKYDLEDRLVDFSARILTLVEHLPDARACNHLAGQLIRSCTSPALIYGEAQAAESRRDFIHKMKMPLKELRETRITLKVITKKKYIKDEAMVQSAMHENNELIAIFFKSISTAVKNSKNEAK